MSTFVSTVNSGAAYVVNDIYKRYINPNAPPKRYVVAGLDHLQRRDPAGHRLRLHHDQDVHSVTKWIVSALIPAFVAPNVLKWHWWRFNGYGFFAGMVGGHGGRRARSPGSLPASARSLPLPAHPGHQLRRLDRRLLCSPSRKATRCSRVSTATCGRGASGDPIYGQVPRPTNPRFQQEPRFPPRRVQPRRGAGLADQPGHLAHLPGHPALDGNCGSRWPSAPSPRCILKFTWYDKLGPGEMYLIGAPVARSPLPPGEG